jgi:hypothetical protein
MMKRIYSLETKQIIIIMCILVALITLSGCNLFITLLDNLGKRIIIEPKNPVVEPGMGLQLTAWCETNAETINITGDVTWKSSNSSVVVIDDNGFVSGLNPGDSTITAYYEDRSGETTVTCRLVESDNPWVTFLGGAGEDLGVSIIKTFDLGYICAGYSDSNIDTPLPPLTSHSGALNDILLIKYNAYGEYQWHTYFGGSEDQSVNSIIQTQDRGFLLAGVSNGSLGGAINPYNGNEDILVAKFSSDGFPEWHTFLGGTDNDSVSAVIQKPDGNYLLTGSCYSTFGSPLAGFNGGSDIIVAEIDPSGFLNWHTFIGGSGYDSGRDLITGPGDYIYVLGQADSGFGTPIMSFTVNTDFIIIELSPSGLYSWHTYLGGSGADYANSIIESDDGNLIVSGHTDVGFGSPLNLHSNSGYDLLLASISMSGTSNWHTFLGGSGNEVPGILIKTSDNRFFLAGEAENGHGSPLNPHTGAGKDIMLGKFDSNGQFLWHTYLGGTGDDVPVAAVLGENDSIVLTGHSTAEFGFPLYPHSTFGNDIFMVKFLSDGTFY